MQPIAANFELHSKTTITKNKYMAKQAINNNQSYREFIIEITIVR